MGYFGNAFVFSAEPAFQAIADALPTCSLRGYKQTAGSVWLLDLWEKPRRGEHHPFTLMARPQPLTLPRLTPKTEQFLREFDRLLAAAAGDDHDCYGADECRLGLAVAAHAGIKTFFFVADDEYFDLALCARPGVLDRFGCRLDRLLISYEDEDGVATVIPDAADEEEEEDELLDLIRGAVRWRIAEPREPEGILYGHAVALWPEEVGNPETTLGIGTWDPFLNLDRDFQVVFERSTG